MSACRRITDAYILVMLLVFPLFTGFHGYSQITDAKFCFLLIATLLWFALLVAVFIHGRLRLSALLPLRPTEIAVLAFLAVCTLSALLSPWFPSSLLGAGRWDGLATLLLYCLIFLGMRRFGQLNSKHLYAVGAVILIQTVIAGFQLLDMNPLWLFPGDLRWSDAGFRYSGAFLGTIGNVDLLTAYLSICIPLLIGEYVLCAQSWPLLIASAFGVSLLLYCGTAAGPVSLLLGAILIAPFVITDRGRLRRCLTALAAVLLAAALYCLVDFRKGQAVIRSAMLFLIPLSVGIICALAAAMLYRRRDMPDIQTKLYQHAVLAAELLIIAVAAATVYLWPGEIGTLYELRCILRGELHESFGSSRILIWRETLAIIPERPLLGGGPGTLALRLKIDFERFVPETGITLRSFADNAHNVYLGYLADTGFLGLLCYLSIIACSVLEILKHRHKTMQLVFACVLLSGWIADCFELGLCLTAPILWLLWGLSGVTECRDAPKGSLRPEGPE